jgi:hypothetical protein
MQSPLSFYCDDLTTCSTDRGVSKEYGGTVINLEGFPDIPKLNSI